MHASSSHAGTPAAQPQEKIVLAVGVNGSPKPLRPRALRYLSRGGSYSHVKSRACSATEILRKYSTGLLYNHSIRVYLFAAEQGRARNLRFDPELLYVAAAFHDLGLIKEFSSQNERFEVDGANAARQFLSTHDIAEDQVQAAWEAIALHTTPRYPAVHASGSCTPQLT